MKRESPPQSCPSLKVTTLTSSTCALYSLGGDGESVGVGGQVLSFKSQLSSLVVNQEYVSLPFSAYSSFRLGHLCVNLDPVASVRLTLYCKVHSLYLSSGSKVHVSQEYWPWIEARFFFNVLDWLLFKCRYLTFSIIKYFLKINLSLAIAPTAHLSS